MERPLQFLREGAQLRTISGITERGRARVRSRWRGATADLVDQFLSISSAPD